MKRFQKFLKGLLLISKIQICDMKIAGFSFQVLSQGFLISKGYRTKQALSADEKRVRDNFDDFKSNFGKILEKNGLTDETHKQCL